MQQRLSRSHANRLWRAALRIARHGTAEHGPAPAHQAQFPALSFNPEPGISSGKSGEAPGDQITRQRTFHVPVQNGGKAGSENLAHFLSWEGGDRFMRASTRHILGQRHAKRHGVKTRQHNQ